MHFRIRGLSSTPFLPYFGLPDAELAALGIIRYLVDSAPGYPDRIALRDAAIGDTVLLLNHVCQDANTPYRAAHAIFIREGATQTYDAVDQVPASMRIRLLSLRGYTQDGMMVDADVVDGTAIETLIARLFEDPTVSYIHVHNAKRGCYAGRIDRA
ncbi:DUF1203 domain-containing protein [Janthinobacterium sp. PC23-8]|uniref:DUF1203 domain-containing protein n=1 Tax=Janthinobacterium sp. PC23-8 TaxID=2012679 RepID=UPI000B96C786|nr:DUF1203 domain-containing protein [Janthinobacterium sp. PC23-8]OYO30885.1 hypothetical protein CD932_06920 [Janthinobacterium sp. PC23-8]